MNLPTNRYIFILPMNSLFVGEFTSTVTQARPKSSSLRTTIPEGIAKLLDLKSSDEVVWTVKAIKGQVEVSLSKK
jgi:bifunctional DNA-binding transcriptional regulator/antitoxin component of YhaV-PrlF toxin-antitoxin module